jgi:2-dehydropantoate 2-reductase
MRIAILGSGVQGTLYGVRLARAGHTVTLIARGRRAAELRTHGAVIEHAVTGERVKMTLPVREALEAHAAAELCVVTVRREQIDAVLPALAQARGVAHIMIMVNHACGSEWLFDALRRDRTILGFPGAGGSIEDGIVRYMEIAEQPTAVEAAASDVISLLEGAGFRVSAVPDMDSWLRRHAVFVTAACGALYEVRGEARRLATDRGLLRVFVRAVREGWAAMDDLGIAPPPLALNAIFRWTPLPLAVCYWARLFASAKGEFYFARHAQHATRELAALAADVVALISPARMPHWRRLEVAIAVAAAERR